MGIAVFVVIAFVMLGVERLVDHKRSHTADHVVTPKS
jgi:hypothetical protein